MDSNPQNSPAPPQPPDTNPETPVVMQANNQPAAKPNSRKLVLFLRFLLVGGGLFTVLVIGLGISFSACFTIKGPPPPQCGPVSFVSLILMPAASLLFLIPLAKKIK